MIKDNIEYSNDLDKANLFAEKLNSVFNDFNGSDFDSKHYNDINQYIESKNYDSIYNNKTVKLFKINELNIAIKKLNNSKTLDSNGISNYIIKKLPSNAKEYLLVLYNKCLSEKKIPNNWKLATVCMLKKKLNNAQDIDNYRPISKTDNLAKLFEKLIADRLQRFLKNNNIIISCQSGFRQNRQTRDNIFHLTQKTLESFNRKKKVCTIFFDIAAAFDKVWHNGLIQKLINIRLPHYLLEWFIEFLTERKFRVRVNDSYTIEHNITTGVPQGAVLSPTLFSIFINDIPTNFKKNKTYSMLFADDLVFYYIYKKGEKTASKNINSHLNNLFSWTKKWRLKLATNKCSYLVFSNGNQNESEKLNLKINNVKLRADNNPTFLGIRFDNHLTFKNQINYLKETCVQRLNIIKILSHKSWCLTKDTLVQVYNVLIRSVLEYSAILAPAISNTNLNTLQVIQNNALRIILKKPILTRTEISDLH